LSGRDDQSCIFRNLNIRETMTDELKQEIYFTKYKIKMYKRRDDFYEAEKWEAYLSILLEDNGITKEEADEI